MFSFEQTALKLEISTQTLRKIIDNKEIEFIWVGSRKRFSQEQINTYLKNNTVKKK